MRYFQGFGGAEWVLFIGGVLVGLVGIGLVWKRRFGAGDKQPGGGLGARLPMVGRVSESTRLLMGIGLLVMGYHMGVWAFPAGVTPVQVGREYWWGVVGGVIVLVVASIGMDRVERNTGGDA